MAGISMMRRQQPLERPGPTATLDDIPGWYVLLAACPNCLRDAVIDRQPLIRQYGKDARLHDLERKLKCTKCGGRGRCRIVARKIPR